MSFRSAFIQLAVHSHQSTAHEEEDKQDWIPGTPLCMASGAHAIRELGRFPYI